MWLCHDSLLSIKIPKYLEQSTCWISTSSIFKWIFRCSQSVDNSALETFVGLLRSAVNRIANFDFTYLLFRVALHIMNFHIHIYIYIYIYIFYVDTHGCTHIHYMRILDYYFLNILAISWTRISLLVCCIKMTINKHFTAHSSTVAYNIAVFVFFNFSYCRILFSLRSDKLLKLTNILYYRHSVYYSVSYRYHSDIAAFEACFSILHVMWCDAMLSNFRFLVMRQAAECRTNCSLFMELTN